MGSVGNTSPSNVQTTVSNWTEVPTKDNEYGFEVEATDSPVVEFNDWYWKVLAELRREGKFYDHDLQTAVDDKVHDLVNQYNDLALYNEDLANIIDKMDEMGVTSDEYWALYHNAADILGIKKLRR